MEYKTGRSLGLNREEAAVYEWQFRFSGDFGRSLMETIALADDDQRQLLSLGFPDEVAGYKKFVHKQKWWDDVVEKANKRAHARLG